MWNANWLGPESLFASPEWNSEETLIEAGAAGHQRGEVDSTDRWRRLRAPGKESQVSELTAVRSGGDRKGGRTPPTFQNALAEVGTANWCSPRLCRLDVRI